MKVLSLNFFLTKSNFLSNIPDADQIIAAIIAADKKVQALQKLDI